MRSETYEHDVHVARVSTADTAGPAGNDVVDFKRASKRNNSISALAARDANRLLAALPREDWSRLQPHLEWVDMPVGKALYESGTVLRHVYFPTTSIVSLVSSMKDGASTEVALVGPEGVVGVCAFMGGGRALSGAVVQSAGHGLRMSAEAIAYHAGHSEALMQQLLCYTQALFTHMAQTAACNLHHVLDQRLCAWLLLNLDRRDDNEVVATQERIAELLGVRREGVTGGAVKLQKAGLIRYSRGRIFVLDRLGLEQRCCECYSVVRQAYDRLLGRAAQGRTAASVGMRRSAAGGLVPLYQQ